MFDNDKKSQMDLETADAILQNVFKACDAEPNKISLKKLEEKAAVNYRTDNVLIIVAAVLLFISILIPLFFKSAQFFVSVDEKSSRPLAITSHEMTTEQLSMSFEGPKVDISKTYIEANDGTIIKPINFDSSKNAVTFPGLTQEANIYIYDINGKCLHLLLTPHN